MRENTMKMNAKNTIKVNYIIYKNTNMYFIY